MLGRNRSHEISMCLDLTPENVASVTDVIGYEYAHQPERLELSLLVTSTQKSRYEAQSDTASIGIEPWFHKITGYRCKQGNFCIALSNEDASVHVCNYELSEPEQGESPSHQKTTNNNSCKLMLFHCLEVCIWKQAKKIPTDAHLMPMSAMLIQ